MLNRNLPEPVEKVCDCGRSLARLGLLNQGNDGTADDGSIGEFADSGYVFRGGDAEAHGDRQRSKSAQALDQAPAVEQQRFKVPRILGEDF